MNEKEARQLKIGTTVIWNGDQSDKGTVTDLRDFGFKVIWENGQVGWIHYFDAEKINLREV